MYGHLKETDLNKLAQDIENIRHFLNKMESRVQKAVIKKVEDSNKVEHDNHLHVAKKYVKRIKQVTHNRDVHLLIDDWLEIIKQYVGSHIEKDKHEKQVV